MLFCVIGIQASEVLPNVADICASFQFTVLHHLAKRVQRALLFCELKKLLPDDRRILVGNHWLLFRRLWLTLTTTLCLTNRWLKSHVAALVCIRADLYRDLHPVNFNFYSCRDCTNWHKSFANALSWQQFHNTVANKFVLKSFNCALPILSESSGFCLQH